MFKTHLRDMETPADRRFEYFAHHFQQASKLAMYIRWLFDLWSFFEPLLETSHILPLYHLINTSKKLFKELTHLPPFPSHTTTSIAKVGIIYFSSLLATSFSPPVLHTD